MLIAIAWRWRGIPDVATVAGPARAALCRVGSGRIVARRGSRRDDERIVADPGTTVKISDTSVSGAILQEDGSSQNFTAKLAPNVTIDQSYTDWLAQHNVALLRFA